MRAASAASGRSSQPASAPAESPRPLSARAPAEPLDQHAAQVRGLRERRARAIADHKARVSHPKSFLLGTAKAALDEQVKEKEAMRAQGKQVDDFYAEQALLMDKCAIYLDQEQKKQVIESELDAAAFRKEKQAHAGRREADLNEKRTAYARSSASGSSRRGQGYNARGGSGSALGIGCGGGSGHGAVSPSARTAASSAAGGGASAAAGGGLYMVFAGEDQDMPARKATQAAQLSSWAGQQVDEKNLRKRLEQEMAQLAADRQEAVTHKAWACERAIEQKRADIARANAEFNRKLAMQKEREKLADKHYEQRCNLQEIQNMLDSDFLSEAPRVTLNPGRSGRSAGFGPSYRRDNMKGLHPQQMHHILAEQAAQREELADRRRAEKEAQLQIDLQEEQERRMAIALDRQRERNRRAELLRLADERKGQAQEAAQKRANLDALYRNQISEEFYAFTKPGGGVCF
eukprot:TRINITY_DN6096_c0_g1_i2.p2 TRINITY_DN6096_c0_g1~~TRINITY_DN6096_c0_g1_i2.p2  ORF type:complete len:462 (+),score=158.71 TRINITY_DN6096_c0_g1_i2:85-1470(+)